MAIYKTPGKAFILDALKEFTDFKLIEDPSEYVIECKIHGLVSTGKNAAEVILDLVNHTKECGKDESYC
ncbi:MAG: hypothetical protein V3V19_11420 [Cocleimonas sp.]